MPTVRHAPLSEFGCCSSNLFISVSLRASGSLVKELPFTAKLDTRVPFFCGIPLAIDRGRLAEHGALPESDICLGKVAKIFNFLASFAVHPWPFLISHELVSKSPGRYRIGTGQLF